MNDFKQEFADIMGDFVNLSDSVTYVCFVMDHSSSMTWNRKQSLSNFNEYLKKVQNEAEEKSMQTVVTVVDFDSKSNVLVDNVLAKDVKLLKEYWIGRGTALYDAIGRGIHTVIRLMNNDPREDKAALFFINTDGFENASQVFKKDQLQKIIKELEDTKKWTFTFLAEGIDKRAVARLSRYSVGNTVSFNKSADGYSMSLLSNIRGIQAYYNARQDGQTQVVNFHNQDTTEAGKRELNA